MLDIAFQNDNHPPPPPSLHEITENTINDNSIKLKKLLGISSQKIMYL